MAQGDEVLSKDEKTGRVEARRVVQVTRRTVGRVVRLTLTDPATHQSQTLTATEDHPVYVQGKGFVPAGQLGIGTSIVTRAGPCLTVSGSALLPEQVGGYTVYNLTVEGDHTYFVGSIGGGAWVHNNDCSNEFIEEAISRAEAAGYRPGEAQRSVNWDNVQELTNLAKQHGNWDFLRGDELIITGKDGLWATIDNGMHRILASGMSGVPLPEDMFLRGDYFSPSRPW